MKQTIQHSEFEKSKIYTMINLIDYVPGSVVSKTIIRKPTGNISVIAIDAGEVEAEKISPFDAFIQIIDGEAEIIIDEQQNWLKTGTAIIIPAHTSHVIKATRQSKMISTVIKSGYEGNII